MAEIPTIIRPKRSTIGKLIDCSSALEAKGLKHLKRGGSGQAVDVHNAGLLNDVMGIILLIDSDSHTVRGIGYLSHRIDNQAVILLAVV